MSDMTPQDIERMVEYANDEAQEEFTEEVLNCAVEACAAWDELAKAERLEIVTNPDEARAKFVRTMNGLRSALGLLEETGWAPGN